MATHDEQHPERDDPFTANPLPPQWLGIGLILIALLLLALIAWAVHAERTTRSQTPPRYTLTLNAAHCPRPAAGQVLVITAAPAMHLGADFTVSCTTTRGKS